MKISACMIVKNEEKMLEKTLPSLSQGVDEIILVDTGSSDNTVKLAEKYGAKVYHFKWNDNFSAARNASLEAAAGDWIIWADADEFLKAEDLQALRKVLEASEEDAYYLPIYECNVGEETGSNFYNRLKVFRNGKGFHFEREFNEQVYTKAGQILETKNFLPKVKIAHWGKKNIDPEILKAKRERNLRIIKKNIEKHANDPYYRYLLAKNYQGIGDSESALEEFTRAVRIDPRGPLAADSRIRAARILIDLKKYQDAVNELVEATKLEPWNAEAYNLIGVIYISVGEYDKAIEVLINSSGLKEPSNVLMGYDVSQYTDFPHFLLGNTYLLKNNKAKALDEFKIAYQYKTDPKVKARIDMLEKEVKINGR